MAIGAAGLGDARDRGIPDVPMWATGLWAAVLVVNTVMLFVGAWRSSPTSDASTYALWTQNLIDRGLYAFEGSGTAEGHGPVTAVVQHAVAVLLGADSWGTVVLSPEAFASRRIGIAVMAMLGVFAAALCARSLLGTWRWGLLAAATLLAVPMWTGHAMFNTSDVPAASGYTLFTAGAILLLKASSTRARIAAAATVTAGVLFGFGTRPGLWVAFLATGAVTVLAIVAMRWRSQGRSAGLRAGILAAVLLAGGSAVGYLVVALIYPAAFADPLTALHDAVAYSGEFPWEGAVLMNGSMVEMPPPWHYSLQWFGNQVPVLIGVFALIGLLLVPAWLLPRARNREPRVSGAMWVGLVLILLQALLLPAAAAVRGSVLYGGVRQLLFVIPAVALLATVGLWWSTTAAQRSGRRVLPVAAMALGCIALLGPTVSQLRLFPFNYAYFNVVAALRPIDGRWSVDYWRVSTADLLRHTPNGAPRDCDRQGGAGLDQCRDYPDFVLLRDEAGLLAQADQAQSNQYYLMQYSEHTAEPPDQCREFDRITRPLHWQTVTLGVISICDFALAGYPNAPLDFTVVRDPQGSAVTTADRFLLWGWEVNPDIGVWASWPTAGIGFTLPPDMENRPVTLSLTGHLQVDDGRPRTMTVTVNGTDVGTWTYDSSNADVSASFDVPVDVVVQQPDGLVIRLSEQGRTDLPLIFLLKSAEVAPATAGWGA